MKLIQLLGVFILLSVNNVTCKPENLTSILEQVPRWENTNLTAENWYIMKQKLTNEQKLINNVAYRGNAETDYRITLRELNLMTREHYSVMINHIGYNLFPLLVATDVDHDKRLSGVGSEFILFLRNGTIQTAKPSPASYEINKDLAHIPVGLFAIISPFFNNPTSPMWRKPLREYQEHIQNSLSYLRTRNMKNTSESVHCEENLTNEEQAEMLSMADDYIEECFTRGSVDFLGYQEFNGKFKPLIHKSIECAVKIQVMSTIRQLTIWKQQLGDEWKDLYVLIPVIWPVARVNPRKQIIEQFMDEDKRMTNIIMAEGAQTIHAAREVLGRVVGDRTMSELVYQHDSARNIEQNVALSTRTDMVSPTATQILDQLIHTTYSLADTPYDEPNDLRFEDYYQIPAY